jgi:hypothetical protein
MNDTERELRAMFARRVADAAEPPPSMPQRLGRRTRLRQVLIVATSLAAVTVLVLASLAAIRIVSERDGGARPADTQVELPRAPVGFLAAALPYASIAYPDGWYLLDTSPLVAGSSQPQGLPTGPILQLSNFDPDVLHAPRCMVEPDQVPDDGVLLSVSVVAPADAEFLPSEGSWPVSLHRPPSTTEPVCEVGTSEEATWTAPSGVEYTAQAIYGEHASQTDVAAIQQAFSTLLFPPTAEPQLSRMSALQGLGTPRVVLGTTTFGSDVLTFVAYLELGRVLWVGAESSGPYAGGATAPHSGSDPNPPISAGLAAVMPAGALLYGTISSEVDRVEVRTDSGEVAPLNVVPLPASLGLDDRFVWAIVPGGGDRSTIVGYDRDGNPIGSPIFPAGPAVTIASGTDPQGGSWTLYLDVTNEGTGLGFAFDHGGGGSGCCLKPLSGDFRLDGYSSGGDGPNPITALASDSVTRVAFEAADGTTLEGQLFPVPDESLGIPQVALVIVPHDVPLQGDLVAYDAAGNELGREPISMDMGEGAASDPSVNAAWSLLRAARDALGQWASVHGESLATFVPGDAAAEIPFVAWNTSPPGSTVPGEVSIRGLAPAEGSELTGWTLAIVGVTPDGNTYCIAVNVDENGGGNFRYGTQDAASYEECRGGWPELG